MRVCVCVRSVRHSEANCKLNDGWDARNLFIPQIVGYFHRLPDMISVPLCLVQLDIFDISALTLWNWWRSANSPFTFGKIVIRLIFAEIDDISNAVCAVANTQRDTLLVSCQFAELLRESSVIKLRACIVSCPSNATMTNARIQRNWVNKMTNPNSRLHFMRLKRRNLGDGSKRMGWMKWNAVYRIAGIAHTIRSTKWMRGMQALDTRTYRIHSIICCNEH